MTLEMFSKQTEEAYNRAATAEGGPWVMFRPVSPPGLLIVATLGREGPTVTGEGGWDVMARARREGMTEYEGTAPITQSFEVLFDGFAYDESVEHDVSALWRLMRERVGPNKEPTVIAVDGPALLHTNLRWVINKLEPRDESRRADGKRTRAFVGVELLEYIAPDLAVSVRSPAAAAVERAVAVTAAATVSVSPPAARTHVVAAGDTLRSIAVKYLGSDRRWSEIGTLNGVRDPRRLTVGQTIKLP